MRIKKNNVFLFQATKIPFDYYIKQGAPTLILLHGLLASKECFYELITRLKHSFSIICPDLPPFGASEKKHDFDYSYRNYADLIMKMMNDLHIQQATIVGHSMGGQIALVCARYYPDRIHSLYLLAPSSYMKASDLIQFWIDHVPNTASLLKYLLESKGIRSLLEFATYEEQVVSDEMLNRYTRAFSHHNMYNALIELFLDHPGDLVELDLHIIQTQCYIIWGITDQILPISIGEQLIKDLPDAILYRLKEKGHLLPEEAPEEIYNIIQTNFS